MNTKNFDEVNRNLTDHSKTMLVICFVALLVFTGVSVFNFLTVPVMGYISIAVGILVVGGLLACALVTVEVDAEYLVVKSTLLRFPLMRIKIDQIDHAAVEQFQKLSWGGWGVRWRPQGKAVVIRGNESAAFQMKDGKQKVIVIRQADRILDLLNAR